ncbi:MAG: M17 family peptidase N-terminal domain-containing protein, partial [Bacteroidota bacterium]
MIFKIKSNLSLNSLPALIIPIDKQTLHSDKLDEIVSMTSLSVAQVRQDFKAAHGTVHLIYTSDAKLFLLGVGEQPNTRQVLLAFRKLAHQHAHQLPSTVGIHLLEEGYQAAYISAAVNGLLLGQYRIGKYKTSTASIHPLESDESSVTIFTKLNAQVAENAAAEGAATAATQRSIMHLVNAPSNKKPPQVLADWAVASGEANGYEVTVFEKERIVELGLGALLAVNRGSETPPRFIIMEYKGEGAMQKIGLLGKGVTF